MHIEPGIVDGTKLVLGYATGAASIGLCAKLAAKSIAEDGGWAGLGARSVIATALVFGIFQLLPHPAVGVSEVHLILGTTLMLLFGAGPAAAGLVLGLLYQGLFFAPFDLPQFGMNVTTLIVPLWVADQIAQRIIPAKTAYVDISYSQVATLSLVYQSGIVSWVAFWVLYGQGVNLHALQEVGLFAAAYATVILFEPVFDLGVLALAKTLNRSGTSRVLSRRMFN